MKRLAAGLPGGRRRYGPLDMAEIDRNLIAALADRERALFETSHPESRRLHDRAEASLLSGVPMNWMTGGLAIIRCSSTGPRAPASRTSTGTSSSTCVSEIPGAWRVMRRSRGRCDTEPGRQGNHADAADRGRHGVGSEMARRFGVPYWQFTLTATDANRFVIRWAREITGRSKIVVHNWCYHGSVDETFATIETVEPWRATETSESLCPRRDDARRRDQRSRGPRSDARRGRRGLCLFEPALTNIGIVIA